MKKSSLSLTAWLLSLTALLLSAMLLASCENKAEKKTSPKVYYGKEETLGGGKARSFVELNGQGNPVRFGVAISEAALNGLPHEMVGVTLEMPAQAAATGFKYVDLGYMPHGHEPQGIYTEPHFDIHFYNITNGERLNILPTGEAKFNHYPPQGYLPAGFVPAGAVPQMGMHWADATGGEFQGKGFTQTFLYGSFDSKVIFYEPMVATAYLKNVKNDRFSIKQPQKFAAAGNYPQSYNIRHDQGAKQYEITLEEFTQKQAN
ncbi:MAG: DUF5602 domain-containing protein [Cytophagales bacterium]|nr:DUF5602 domain-containing protein [Cytophagales bacterium]